MDRSALLDELGFEEEQAEIIRGGFHKTGFPKSKKKYHLMWEVNDLSLEGPYYWILDIFKEGFPIIEKLEDSFAAAENSAFFGSTQQKLGAQQDRITNILVSVGKMIKELFQMVRELRIIDERLTYYNEADAQLKKPLKERSKGSEVTLKGIFIDLVQGGAKSPASVFGMSRELEFVTLPDLFFDTPPFESVKEIDSYIEGLRKDFNEQVLRVLQRHLRHFMEWKKRTHKEHINRRGFMLKYLAQHYEIIKMYITWIKPYLRHVSRLSFKDSNMKSADMVSAFEGSMLDIEFLAMDPVDIKVKGEKVEQGYHCCLVTFNYRTRPELKVIQDGYQRGPVHIGKLDMYFRVYNWTQQELENYKKFKEKETLALLEGVSTSVQDAMQSLGDELEKYIAQAKGLDFEEKTKDQNGIDTQKKPIIEKLFGDFYTPKKNKPKKRSYKDREKLVAINNFKNEPGKKFNVWVYYRSFKKAHRMVMW